MVIKKISLLNFRQFKDVTIDFSQDPQKNITVILGDNTTGKTTLIRSFIWCLYGINSFKKNKIILNHDVQMEMEVGETSQAQVTLNIEHNGYQYKIITTEEFKKTGESKVVSLSNGKPTIKMLKGKEGNIAPIKEDLVASNIRNILPDELKDYFFFDGEDNSIDTITGKGNLTEAVSNLLHLKNVESLIDIFNPNKSRSVYARFKDDLIIKNDLVSDLIQGDIDKLQKKIQLAEEDIKTRNDEMKKLETDIDQRTEEIEANQDAAEDEKKLQSAKRNLEDARQNAEEDFSAALSSLNTGDGFLESLFSASFNHYQIEKTLDSSHFKSENSYHDINGKAVDELIKRGRCLCGAEIKDGNDAYKHLLEAKQHMEPIDFGGYASTFKNTELMQASLSSHNIEKLNKKFLDTKDDLRQIESYSTEVSTLSKKLQGRADVGALEANRRTLQNQLLTQQSYIDQDKKNISDTSDDLKEKNNQLAKASENNAHNDEVKKSMSYCERIFDLASQYLNKQKDKVRADLEKEVNVAFNQMYSGKRSVAIDPNFHFHTYLREATTESIDDSGGLSTVTNFAFVAGLISLAKKRIVSTGADSDLADNNPRDNNYPLVMDAPFSKTDSTHIRNVCRVIPTYCNQLIMALMEKDYKEAEPELSLRIGHKYRFKKISETETQIVEEDA